MVAAPQLTDITYSASPYPRHERLLYPEPFWEVDDWEERHLFLAPLVWPGCEHHRGCRHHPLTRALRVAKQGLKFQYHVVPGSAGAPLLKNFLRSLTLEQ